MRSLIQLFCLLIFITSCNQTTQFEELKSYDYWILPECVDNGVLVEYNDLSAPTDYGFSYRIKLDSNCIQNVIDNNNLILKQINGKDIYLMEFDNSISPQIGFFVDFSSSELVVSYLEE